MFALTAAGYMFDAFDIGLLIFIMPALASDLHLTPPQIGTVFTTTFVGMFCGTLMVGYIVDRFGTCSTHCVGISRSATSLRKNSGICADLVGNFLAWSNMLSARVLLERSGGRIQRWQWLRSPASFAAINAGV